MFRLATMNDMLELIDWKRQSGSNVDGPWGLKCFGDLWCERMIEQHQPAAVLEVGVGFRSDFHDMLTPGVDYWTIDSSGFYDPESFREGVASRPNATHVDALVGDFAAALPDDHFDVSFSISALEHSDPANADAMASDLFRITAPGGVTVHTIDTPISKPQLRFEPWLAAFTAAGFEFDEPPFASSGVQGVQQRAVLVEALERRVNYGRAPQRFWEATPAIRDHQGTIMVAARKPA